MYYPPTKFGDDESSGFCFRMHTHTDTHMYRADKRPVHASDYVSVSNKDI